MQFPSKSMSFWMQLERYGGRMEANGADKLPSTHRGEALPSKGWLLPSQVAQCESRLRLL